MVIMTGAEWRKLTPSPVTHPRGRVGGTATTMTLSVVPVVPL